MPLSRFAEVVPSNLFLVNGDDEIGFDTSYYARSKEYIASGLIQEKFTATSGTDRAHFGWLTNHAIGMFARHWSHHSTLQCFSKYGARGSPKFFDHVKCGSAITPCIQFLTLGAALRVRSKQVRWWLLKRYVLFLEPEYYFRFPSQAAVGCRRSVNSDSNHQKSS